MSWNDTRGPKTTALVALDDDANNALNQNYRDVAIFRTTMASLAKYATVLSPQMTAIQPGMSIGLAVIEVAEHELAPVQGAKEQVQPTKSVINKVAAAAGVQWMPEHCYRIDDASDPLYCNYRAGGRRPGIDGTVLPFYDEYELDLRPGAPKVVQVVAAAIKHNASAYNAGSQIDASLAMVIPTTRKGELDFMNAVARYNSALAQRGGKQDWRDKLKDPHAGLNQQRAHVQSMAITKAKLRALRSALGMPIAGPKEIMKRFVVAVPFFSGEGLSPGVRERVEEQQAMAAIASRQMLFGGRPAVQATPMRAFTAQDVPSEMPRQPSPPPPIAVDENFDPDSEPDWDGPPPATVEPDGPTFEELDRDTRVAQLIALAKKQGRIGDGPKQCTEAAVAKWDDETIATSWRGLQERAA